MENKALAVYLNDHLAGSAAALDLLKYLEERCAGTDAGAILSGLYRDIAEDRQELESIMDRLGIGKSLRREAATWLGSKATEIKLKLDDPHDRGLSRLESLDLISSGIDGKLALWRSLAAASVTAVGLGEADYARLQQRAVDQRERAEGLRQAAARSALDATGS